MSDEKTADFERFATRKTREASTAPIERLSTLFDRSRDAFVWGVGNAWSRLHYDGDFCLFRQGNATTAVSLVFVQSKNRNTGGDPSALGGGATDKHLIYEGLSRVAADAVLAGARSVDAGALFSVWHPELVALRASFNLPRHPSQIVVSRHGRLDFDALLFNVQEVPVYVIAAAEHMTRHASTLGARPWIRHIPLTGDDLRSALEQLREEEGVQRISVIGGRSTASHLVDSGLAQDLYLTTTSQDSGDPDTPWYSGAAVPSTRVITQKQWFDGTSRLLFEHILIGR
jgi:riboflavin biosynthesis pyrimidine reductase